jgi:hypothetical protein
MTLSRRCAAMVGRALDDAADSARYLGLVAIRRAVDAQALLAADKRVSNRVKPIDLLVAGVADRHGAAVLHYDGDYDLIAKHTDLSFDGVWVVKRGGGVSADAPKGVLTGGIARGMLPPALVIRVWVAAPISGAWRT